MFLFHSVVCRHGDKCSMIKMQHLQNRDISVEVVSAEDFSSSEMPTAVCMRLVSNLTVSSVITF
jgi:hypothetical protein